MRIPLPRTPRWVTRWIDWINEPIWGIEHPNWNGKYFEVRRIDVLIAIGGIVCVGWYGYTGGWRWALVGGAVYLMVVMTALWIL